MNSLPDTQLTREALDVVRPVLPPAILRHSQRAFLLAGSYAEAKKIAFDEEGLYVAALFHDVGLIVREDGQKAFPERSADALRTFMAEPSARPRAAALASAIEAHMALWPKWSRGVEAGLLHVGAWMDVVRRGAASLPEGLIAEIETSLPRAAFEKEFRRHVMRSMTSLRACFRLFVPVPVSL
jgi:hypothetical protein